MALSNAERHRSHRARRKSAGLCIGCGRAAPEVGRSRCLGCLEYRRPGNRAAQERRRLKVLAERPPPPMGWHKLRGLRRRLERWALTCKRCGGAAYLDGWGDLCCRACGAVLRYSSAVQAAAERQERLAASEFQPEPRSGDGDAYARAWARERRAAA